MTPYIVMLMVMALCIWLEESSNSAKTKNGVFIAALLPYIILMTFKDVSVGADTMNYLHSFKAMSQYDFRQFLSFDEYGYERIEVGYKFLIWLLSRITDDGHILLLFTALISSRAMYLFIKKNATNWSLALFIFLTLGFFQFAMSGIRQTIAISIVLFGYGFIRERKLIKFSLLVMIAMLFHKSAIFFFPAYFVAGMKLNRKNISLAFVSTFLLYFVAGDLFLAAADLLEYDYNIESTNNGYIFFGLVFLITVLSIMFRKRLTDTKTSNSILITLNLISLALWTMRLVSRTAERISLYYMPYSYLTLEQIISSRKKGEKTVWMLASIILCGYLCLRRLSHQDEFSNFKFFFGSLL